MRPRYPDAWATTRMLCQWGSTSLRHSDAPTGALIPRTATWLFGNPRSRVCLARRRATDVAASSLNGTVRQ